MSRELLWRIAKGLELVGMVVVLVGLMMSISLGMEDEGLKSMAYSGYGLVYGGAIFLVGYLLERKTGTR